MKFGLGSQSTKHSAKERERESKRVFLSILLFTILCNDQFIIYILFYFLRAQKEAIQVLDVEYSHGMDDERGKICY